MCLRAGIRWAFVRAGKTWSGDPGGAGTVGDSPENPDFLFSGGVVDFLVGCHQHEAEASAGGNKGSIGGVEVVGFAIALGPVHSRGIPGDPGIRMNEMVGFSDRGQSLERVPRRDSAGGKMAGKFVEGDIENAQVAKGGRVDRAAGGWTQGGGIRGMRPHNMGVEEIPHGSGSSFHGGRADSEGERVPPPFKKPATDAPVFPEFESASAMVSLRKRDTGVLRRRASRRISASNAGSA